MNRVITLSNRAWDRIIKMKPSITKKKLKAICPCGKPITKEDDERMKKEWEAYLKAHPELKDHE